MRVLKLVIELTEILNVSRVFIVMNYSTVICIVCFVYNSEQLRNLT